MKTNSNRRHLSGKDKAAAMWQLRREFKMSQTTIARMLSMRQPSVSQLMNKYRPDDADDLTETIGEDGRVTNNPSRRAPDDELSVSKHPEPVAKWAIGGVAFSAIQRARAVLAKHPVIGIDEWSMHCLLDELTGLRNDIDDALESM